MAIVTGWTDYRAGYRCAGAACSTGTSGALFLVAAGGEQTCFSGDEAGAGGADYCVTATSAGRKNCHAAGERGNSRAYDQLASEETVHRPSLYAGEFYAAPGMACRHSPPALPVCDNRANRRPGKAGAEAVWLRSGIRFCPPLYHQDWQFSLHNTVGVLSGTAAISACDVGFTTCRFMVWDNGLDGGRKF